MGSSLFTRPKSAALAAALSAVAIFAMAFYIAAPSVTPSFAAEYIAVSAAKNKKAKPAGNTVSGVVHTASGKAIRSARVTITYSVAGKRITVTAKVDRRGEFKVAVPKGVATAKVTIVERPNGRTTSGTVKPKPGSKAHVTVVFPPRGSGILPGLFPY